jgi:hypothetical protein
MKDTLKIFAEEQKKTSASAISEHNLASTSALGKKLYNAYRAGELALLWNSAYAPLYDALGKAMKNKNITPEQKQEIILLRRILSGDIGDRIGWAQWHMDSHMGNFDRFIATGEKSSGTLGA